MPAVDHHPRPAELEAFALGELDGDALASVEVHLSSCPECQQAAADAPADTFVGLLRAAQVRGVATGDTPALTVADTFAGKPAGAERSSEPPAELLDHPRYRLLRPLGVGGMGTVWLAEHKVMGRLVALKVIRPEILARPGAVERFRREAHAAARLHHPNIVEAYDAEQAGGLHFLVMEYVDGRTLADIIAKDGRLPPAQACRIAIAAARAVQHAHDHGLVHRDLKPHNVMICERGMEDRASSALVKVLDFGLATFASGAESSLTGANMVVGTPDYIAPEQAEDPRAADGRSDVYALGCTLYEMLTGRVPFPGESVLRKLDAHRGHAPAALPADIPARLAAVVQRMMAKRPTDRYQTPEECAAALEAVAVNDRATMRPRLCGWKARSRERLLALALAAVFCGLLAGVVLRVQTGDGEVVITPESPDVQVVLMQGGKEIQILDTKTQKRVTVPVGNYDVAVKGAPDGLDLKTDRIRVRRGQETLVTIEYVARPPAHVGEGVAAQEHRFDDAGEIRRIMPPWPRDDVGQLLSADGKRVLTPAGWTSGEVDRLQVEEVTSGTLVVTLGQAGEPISSASLAADGKSVLYAARGADGYSVHVRNLVNGDESLIRVGETKQEPTRLQLSADGKLLAYTLHSGRGDVETGVLAIGGQPLVKLAPKDPPANWNARTVLSANGKFAVTVSNPSTAGAPPGTVAELFAHDLSAGTQTRMALNFHAADPFVHNDGQFGVIGRLPGAGFWVQTWGSRGAGTVKQNIGLPDSQAAFGDGRGARVAVYTGERTIRVEDVGGWTTAVFVTGPFERLKGCWLSADGRTMAVQTETHLKLYRLPASWLGVPPKGP